MLNRKKNILSHNYQQNYRLEEIYEQIKQKIMSFGNKSHVTVDEQLFLLDSLCEFELGRFLLCNKGLNGYWTYYILMHPYQGKVTGLNHENKPFTELEKMLLEQAPVILATQQRYRIFLNENQKSIQTGAKLASIPCGLMLELGFLDYSYAQEVSLYAIDLDENNIPLAETILKEHGLLSQTQFFAQNAWEIHFKNEFDLISTNGLTIYEQSDEKVNALYEIFYHALKPNGRLVASYLTPPPLIDPQSEWDLNQIDQKALRLQNIILSDVIGVKWQHYRTTAFTRAQLETIRFKDISICYDNAKMFPTVVAIK